MANILRAAKERVPAGGGGINKGVGLQGATTEHNQLETPANYGGQCGFRSTPLVFTEQRRLTASDPLTRTHEAPRLGRVHLARDGLHETRAPVIGHASPSSSHIASLSVGYPERDYHSISYGGSARSTSGPLQRRRIREMPEPCSLPSIPLQSVTRHKKPKAQETQARS